MSMITVEQAKTFLNINSTNYDDELPFYLDAAERMWVNRGGPRAAAAEATIEYHDGGIRGVVVNSIPIDTITEVREASGATSRVLEYQEPGAGGSAFGYFAENSTGTLIRMAAGSPVQFAEGKRNIRVEYIPGFSNVPEDIQLAVLLLIKHMWETQRGIGKRPGLGGVDEWRPSEGFAWPNRCEQILAGYKVPGIA